MAAGKPVVALARGGAAETVVDGETGILFTSASIRALIAALQLRDATSFDPQRIRARAAEFERRRFLDAWRELLVELGVNPALYELPTRA
jgi:glycosyltransferase involved in cell wall biosynthesis